MCNEITLFLDHSQKSNNKILHKYNWKTTKMKGAIYVSSFLETYGVAIFTLVLVAILIAFAGPLGMKIKNATTDKVCQTEQIGKDEITVATGGTVRPAEPTEAVDKVYCIYYDDGEMTISQNKIESEAGRTVVNKGFYSWPKDCTLAMTTVRFVGAVKPKSCKEWFGGKWSSNEACKNLTEIKNMKNLYTNECINMSYMFNYCKSLTSLDVSNFDTSQVSDMSHMFNSCHSLTSLDVSKCDTIKVTDMSHMFSYCESLTSLDVSKWGTSKVTDMDWMFGNCSSLTSLDLSNFDISKVTRMYDMFVGCSSLKSITATQTVKDKILKPESNTDFPSGVTWIIK